MNANEKVIEYLNKPGAVYAMRKENMDDIRKSLEIINNKDGDINVIKRCIDYLISLTVEIPITGDFNEFLLSYSEILSEWCQEGHKDLIGRINYLKHLAENTLSLSDMSSHLKEVTSKLINSTQYTPYTWKLSRHYFNLIDDGSSGEQK